MNAIDIYVLSNKVIARAYDRAGRQPPTERSWPLPGDVLPHEPSIDARCMAGIFKTALTDICRDSIPANAHVTLILPPLTTLDRVITLPAIAGNDAVRSIRTAFGPAFGDHRVYGLRWVETEQRPVRSRGDTTYQVYASLYRRRVVSLYQRTLLMAGARRISVIPFSWGAFRLCPATPVLVLFDEGDGIMRAVVVKERLPVSMNMRCIEALKIPSELATFVSRVGTIDTENMPVMLPYGWHNPEIDLALKRLGRKVLDPDSSNPVTCPVNLSNPSRNLDRAVATAFIAVVAQIACLFAWNVSTTRQISQNRSMAARFDALRLANARQELERIVPSITQNPAEAQRNLCIDLYHHLKKISTGVDIKSIRMSSLGSPSPGQPQHPVLQVTGTGDLDSLLKLEESAGSLPAAGAAIVSILKRTDGFVFELKVRWQK